ncbi:MAG: hypothetical protein IJL26_03810 [Clostridia bacterium]|nr:hypothetical protein [Clostridia bacterium]
MKYGIVFCRERIDFHESFVLLSKKISKKENDDGNDSCILAVVRRCTGRCFGGTDSVPQKKNEARYPRGDNSGEGVPCCCFRLSDNGGTGSASLCSAVNDSALRGSVCGRGGRFALQHHFRRFKKRKIFCRFENGKRRVLYSVYRIRRMEYADRNPAESYVYVG